MINEDFYPTPKKLIGKMLEGVEVSELEYVLEPSAGKGDMCDYLKEARGSRNIKIDTIEIEPELQMILRGKEYKVIYDDFLTFNTNKKYDLIFANFPFSDGDLHLKKALEIQEQHGGGIVCLVNAETLKNPYTNLRKAIAQKLTSNILKEIESKLEDLREYDFNKFNIIELEKEMNSKVTLGVEKSILDLFETCSHKFSYHEEFSKNLHYYNGWKSNKAYKINKKVILPMNGFSSWGSKDRLEYYIHERIDDMVKVLNYLSDDPVPGSIPLLTGAEIKRREETGNFRDLHFYFFTATFFKKGTCHITFLDDRLLEKFNIYGSQRKGWLPPSYGKKSYKEMDKEEQVVVDEFQGEEAYSKVISEKEYYLVENQKFLLQEAV